MGVYALSVFFPGYKNIGGYHSKYSVQTFYEKILKANVGMKIDKWLIGWQRFTIPGMEIENEYSNGLEIPECVEFKVIPHVMTPLKVIKFLYNLVPENETVLFVDFLWNEFPEIKSIPSSVHVTFQENPEFYYKTLFYFTKKSSEIEFNDSDEIIVKIQNKDKYAETREEFIHRKLVSLEEIAILEFYGQKYPSINDESSRSIQFLGGKLNITVPSGNKKVQFLNSIDKKKKIQEKEEIENKKENKKEEEKQNKKEEIEEKEEKEIENKKEIKGEKQEEKEIKEEKEEKKEKEKDNRRRIVF